ncbi:MAG: group hemoglobin [Flavipsychrobacter sp.]|jgi:hemoglobin|nr:group hemoglobin [Flavipsychrobacter sp.]
MKTDILGRNELEVLVNHFYDKVKADPEIGYLFAHVNWERHLPVMYNFWENTLFFNGGYTGNPLKSHQALHKKSPLSHAHFQRWQELFIATVEELYEGEKAELAKQRALSISTVMQIKIL